MSYVKSRRRVEHTWICSACKATNRGRDLTCPSCGKTKTGEKYNESVKVTVTDPKVHAIGDSGPNWACSFCRFDNRGNLSQCAQCGVPREQSDRAQQARVSKAVFPEKQVPVEIPKIFVPPEPPKVEPPEPEPPRSPILTGSYRDAAYKPFVAPTAPAPKPAPPPEPEVLTLEPDRPSLGISRSQIVKLVALAGGFALLITFLVWLFSPWHEHVRVSSATWSRTRDLHHRVTLSGEGWGTPSGAFNASCVSRQHGTHNCNPYDCHPHDVDCHCHQVADGESCHESCTSGENGFSDCEEVCETEYTEECDTCTEYDTCYEQCPTYDDWCTYNYYDWPIVATRQAHGTDHDPVVWPDLTPPQDGDVYRIEQAESYHVVFTNQNGTWTTDPESEPAFERYHAGRAWDIQVTHAGTVTPIHEESTP